MDAPNESLDEASGTAGLNRQPKLLEITASLDSWLSAKECDIPKRWKKIGREVFARKTMLLAAAADLEKKSVPNPFVLAATDVFVEKAQKTLTTRALWLISVGAVMSVAAVAGLFYFGCYVFATPLSQTLGDLWAPGQNRLDGTILALFLFKISTAGALVVIASHFLIVLSKATFDEGVKLHHRRHALRFGRLYVYVMQGKIKFKELEEAFKWNYEFKTAFKEIATDKFPKTPGQKLAEGPAEIIRAGADLSEKVVAGMKKRRITKSGQQDAALSAHDGIG